MSIPDTYCLQCKQVTPNSSTLSDIEFRKSKRSIALVTKCSKCNKRKSRFIGKDDMKKFPLNVRNQIDKLNTNDVLPAKDVEGGFFPLLALIPLVAKIAVGAATAAGAIAAPIILNKQAEEQNRHNLELEKIARGNGYGEGVDDDEEEIKQAIALLQGRGYMFA